MVEKIKKVKKVREPGVRYVSATELRNNASEIINEVAYGKKIVAIERHGEEIARIIPKLSEEKELTDDERIAKLKEIWGSIPDLDADAIRKDFGDIEFKDLSKEL